MEVYKSVKLNVPFDRFSMKSGNDERTTHKFYGDEKGGHCERENDAPELPIFWYAMREIIGKFGGG